MGEFQVEGVKISFTVCGHCGAVPTEADALKFIKHHSMTCDFCRNKIRVTSGEMSIHRKDGYGQGWDGPWGVETHMKLRPEGQDGIHPPKFVHLECYRKMFPDGDGVRRSE